jgi:hypothetical protein
MRTAGITLYLFNLADACLTMKFVVWGEAIELNPIMGSLISIHPVAFLFYKIVIVGALVLFATEIEGETDFELKAVWTVAIIYILIFVYHLVGIFLL